jgi:hypothetical protein
MKRTKFNGERLAFVLVHAEAVSRQMGIFTYISKTGALRARVTNKKVQ